MLVTSAVATIEATKAAALVKKKKHSGVQVEF